MHALHSGKDVKAYAASVGRNRATVNTEVLAARVAEACATHVAQDLSNYFRHLTSLLRRVVFVGLLEKSEASRLRFPFSPATKARFRQFRGGRVDRGLGSNGFETSVAFLRARSVATNAVD